MNIVLKFLLWAALGPLALVAPCAFMLWPLFVWGDSWQMGAWLLALLSVTCGLIAVIEDAS